MTVKSPSNSYLNEDGRQHNAQHQQQQQQQQHSFDDDYNDDYYDYDIDYNDHCERELKEYSQSTTASQWKEPKMVTARSSVPAAAPTTDHDPPSSTTAESPPPPQQQRQRQRQQMAMIERLQEQISYLESKNDAKDQLISDLMEQLQKSELRNKCHTDIDSKLSTFFRAALFNPEEDTVNGDIGSGDDLSTASEISNCKSDSSMSMACSAPSIVHARLLQQPQQPQLSSLSSSPKLQRPPQVQALHSYSDHSLNQNCNNIGNGSNINNANIIELIQRWLFSENGQLRDAQSLLTEYCLYLNSNQSGVIFDEFSVTMSLTYPITSMEVQQDIESSSSSSSSASYHTWKWKQNHPFQQHEISSQSSSELLAKPFKSLMNGQVMEFRMKVSDYQQEQSQQHCRPDDNEWFQKGNYQDYFALPMYHQGRCLGVIEWSKKKTKTNQTSNVEFSDRDIHTFFYQSMHGLSTVMRFYTNEIIMMTMDTIIQQHVTKQMHDVTTQNQRLISMNVQVMKQAQDQLKHFAMMSHEIRTPLNCIIGMSNLLLESTLPPPPSGHGNEDNDHALPFDNNRVRESIEMITESGDLLLAVVDDVLDYSKLASGNVEIEIGPTNIRRTVRPVVESIRMKAAAGSTAATTETNTTDMPPSKADGLELRVDISDAIPSYVDIDGRRLQQILYNLLGNAVKFGSKGKYVDFTIGIEQNEQETTTISTDTMSCVDETTSKSQSYLVFSIKDYGKGIAIEDRKKIFQPFQQSSSNDAADGGTGLGLAITSQLCKVLGGNIAVTSECGKWTEFVVRLPLIESGVSEIEEESKIGQDGGSVDTRSSFRKLRRGSSRKLSAPIFSALDKQSKSFNVKAMGKGPSHDYPALGKLQRSQSHNIQGNSSSVAPQVPPTPSMIASPPESPSKSTLKATTKTTNSTTTTTTSNEYSTIKALIAEDNRVNQKVLVRTLNMLGLTDIDVVENGQEAVNKSADIQYDIIFMDWMMPVMDGLQATKLITARRQECPDQSHPRIVFLTAHALDDYRSAASGAGGDAFLSKPFKRAGIQDLLDKFELGTKSNR
jgi:signal transduction histidine kinase/CheY-like chemotaxis protein